MIAWVSESQDGDGGGVFAQRFSALGAKVGGEIQVNTSFVDDQAQPAIAVLDSGGFVIAWQGYQPGEGDGIYFQRFNTNGGRLGGEVRANLTLQDQQVSPSIAALSGGGFVLSWQSYAQDGDEWGVYARRFGANGFALGGARSRSTRRPRKPRPSRAWRCSRTAASSSCGAPMSRRAAAATSCTRSATRRTATRWAANSAPAS